MKVSVSLPTEDLRFLDDYVRTHGFASRSAVVHEAIKRLAAARLPDAYEAAWTEWHTDGSAVEWDGTAADGLPPA